MRREGGCLCGAVRYAVDGPLRDVLVCHCPECRRWAGRAWAATAARREQLALLEDRGLRWTAAPASDSGASHGSCAECGASLFWDAPGRPTVSIGVGTLDDAAGLELAGHVYARSAQPWERPPAGATTFPAAYPADAAPLRWRP
ncbi:hypothetical protein Gocc_0997 [Gaiella occulta]|uniref:CENP-V/GFA domain-containing protein n=1 Tax=Gaiella occulta TaxID=1002870 RepID=A0A7M2YYU3_9ACTN|nr:GFA family protein [Gaiella occulta]RDI75199.1 hypothetical protein Gocc_0997 [Gaiella occulta]